MDGLFACYVMDWRRIPPNRVGGKLCPSQDAKTIKDLTFLFGCNFCLLKMFFIIIIIILFFLGQS
jgi:hypothetical protein